MMCKEVKRGSVVRSLAGRNKDKVMCVLRVDGAYIYASDGKEYSLAKPKRKNIKHIEPTGAMLTESEMEFDSRLKKALGKLINISQ